MTKDISPNTLRYWVDNKKKTVLGFNFDHAVNEQLAVAEAKIEHLKNRIKALRYVMGFLKLLLLSDEKHFYKTLKFNKAKLIHVMERLALLDFKTTKACQFLGITPKRYHYLKSLLTRKCNISLRGLCYKRNPNQITKQEENSIVEYTNLFYPDWSLISIWHRMRNDLACFIGKSTFYDYCRLLDITKKPTKKKRGDGKTKASAPFEILHMDVTKKKLNDGSTAYVYVLMDNYSRYIFSMRASLTLSSEENKLNILNAIENHWELFCQQNEIRLVCDGGGENMGEVDILLKDIAKNSPYKLLKQIANNVTLFNTLVEACHYNLKRYHFLKKGYDTIEELQEHLPQCMYGNNCVIPKNRLHGELPDKVLRGEAVPNKDKYKELEEAARKSRIEMNRSFNCDLLCLKELN